MPRARTASSTILILALLLAAGRFSRDLADPPPKPLYAGANNCKECHARERQAELFAKWEASGHRKAFQTLATDKAKAIAKEKNIADAQTDKGCLSCHVTASDEPSGKLVGGFDKTLGVQCESCHGPGVGHIEARVAVQPEQPSDELQELPEGEVPPPGEETCLKCHNEKSPTYKPFDYQARLKDIAHLDPRRERPADFMDKFAERTAAKRAPEKK